MSDLAFINTLDLNGLLFQQKDDGVYLKKLSEEVVYDSREIDRLLLDKGVFGLDLGSVQQLLESEQGAEAIVAKHLFRVDGRLQAATHLEVNEDRLVARIRIDWSMLEGRKVFLEEVFYLIRKFRIDPEPARKRLERFLEIRTSKAVVIAVGTAPVPGKDAELEYLVDTDLSSKPLMLEDGSVDFKNLRMVNSVEKGAILCRKKPPTPGKPGVDVFGIILHSKPGKDVRLVSGKNVVVSEDGFELKAGCHGHCYQKNNVFHIDPIYLVKGNVDFSTGNIMFNGDVFVDGDVQTGFKITTDGNITVRGVVEGADLVSREGSIRIGAGILGQGKARIVARGCVNADFVQDAEIRAGETININDYILNSKLYAEDEVVVKKPTGFIRGGSIHAGKCIKAAEFGSSIHLPTRIHLAEPNQGFFEQEHPKLLAELTATEEELQNLNKEYRFLKLMEARLHSLSEAKEQRIAELYQMMQSGSRKLDELHTALQNLAESNNAKKDDVKVVVSSIARQGVIFAINKAELELTKDLKRCEIFEKDGRIIHERA